MFEIQKKRTQATVSHNIRFTEELYAEMNEVVAHNDISFNSLVLQCCRYALDHLNKADNQQAQGE